MPIGGAGMLKAVERKKAQSSGRKKIDLDPHRPGGAPIGKSRQSGGEQASFLASGDSPEQEEPADPLLCGQFSIRCQSIAHSKWFHRVVIAAVLANIVQLGCNVEWPDQPWKTVWTIFDHFFAFVFFFEMVVKVAALGKGYFLEAPLVFDKWNLIDFVLAWLGVIDMWILPIFVTGSRDSLGVIRIFRLLRLCRMIKVVQTHRQLQVLVNGIAASLGGMFWTGLLLLIVLYACAIFCVTMIGKEEYEGNFNNEEYFGTISRAVVTLFGVVLLAEWSTVVRPVFENQPMLTPFFFIFVVLTSCGMLNVIIGIIVERTNEAAERMKEDDAEALRRDRMIAMTQLADTLRTLESPGDDNIISEREMMKAAQDPAIHHKLMEVELPHGFGVQDLYVMLDNDADMALTAEEFINGMYRLTYSNDFQRICLIQYSMAKLRQEMRRLHSDLVDEMTTLMKGGGQQLLAEYDEMHTNIIAGMGSAGSPTSVPSPRTNGVVKGGGSLVPPREKNSVGTRSSAGANGTEAKGKKWKKPETAMNGVIPPVPQASQRRGDFPDKPQAQMLARIPDASVADPEALRPVQPPPPPRSDSLDEAEMEEVGLSAVPTSATLPVTIVFPEEHEVASSEESNAQPKKGPRKKWGTEKAPTMARGGLGARSWGAPAGSEKAASSPLPTRLIPVGGAARSPSRGLRDPQPPAR